MSFCGCDAGHFGLGGVHGGGSSDLCRDCLGWLQGVCGEQHGEEYTHNQNAQRAKSKKQFVSEVAAG